MQVAYILSSRRRRLLWPNRMKTTFKGKVWKPQAGAHEVAEVKLDEAEEIIKRADKDLADMKY